MTIKTLIATCVQRALKLPRDPLQIDVRDLALDSVNSNGQRIHDAWPWDNEKLDEFQITPVSNIITFKKEVDVIRAIRQVDPTDAEIITPIFNADEVLAVSQYQTIGNLDAFEHLADAEDGRRRVRVDATDTTNFAVLATGRFAPFTLDDYEFRIFAIDNAEQALIEFVCDDLRIFRGMQPLQLGPTLLQNALDKEIETEGREVRIVPREPIFTEIGDWQLGVLTE